MREGKWHILWYIVLFRLVSYGAGWWSSTGRLLRGRRRRTGEGCVCVLGAVLNNGGLSLSLSVWFLDLGRAFGGGDVH